VTKNTHHDSVEVIRTRVLAGSANIYNRTNNKQTARLRSRQKSWHLPKGIGQWKWTGFYSYHFEIWGYRQHSSAAADSYTARRALGTDTSSLRTQTTCLSGFFGTRKNQQRLSLKRPGQTPGCSSRQTSVTRPLLFF